MTSMTILHTLASLGQSIWYDNISRQLLRNGELQRMVDQGLRGVTSNPTIFEKAISGSDAYDEQIRLLLGRTPAPSTGEIISELMVQDIRDAADVLRPVCESTGGADGFVSIEVTPTKARDTDGTMVEARDLWKRVGRPNLMVKIPGTVEGLPAIRQMIREGININVTLLFSLERYLQVAEVYCAGLEQRVADGLPVDRVASVASVFVSRIDTMVDDLLQKIVSAPGGDRTGAEELLGTAAVGNAKMIYQAFESTFTSPRFRPLAAKGARPQRPLWASTGTKNPAYPDLKYVDTLVGPSTVNTVPPSTYLAILDHGRTTRTVDAGMEETRNALAALKSQGIDLHAVTAALEREGVAAFERSFDGIVRTIDRKRAGGA
jgi:transaldolase